MKKKLITEQRALNIIQLIVAVALVTLGIYMAGPWYIVDAEVNAFGLVADNAPVIAHGIGAMYAASGVLLILGLTLHKKRLRRWGQWATVVSYTMIVATRVSIVGFFPMVWVFQLTGLLVIATIILMDWGD